MIYKFIENKKVTSSFIREEYFPVIVEFSKEELNNHFIEFNYRDTDMLELSVNPETNELKRLSLTLCNHFVFKEKSLILPDYTEGCLFIEGPDKTECSCFSVDVYSNDILITLSEEPVAKYLKCGQLIFGLSQTDNLVNIYITSLSSENINHVISESKN